MSDRKLVTSSGLLLKYGKKTAALTLILVTLLGVILAVVTQPTIQRAAPGRSDVPEFVIPKAEMQDRLRKPALTEEERAKQFDEKFDAVKRARDPEPPSEKR